MLLSAVIICCVIVANAEPPLNSYSYTGDSNGYDYNTVTNNGYLSSKDSYQNSGNFYGAGDTSHKLSNHIGGHSLINAGNQGSIGGDVGNSYKGYSANEQGSEYGGYSNPYENSENSDSYTRTVTSTPFRGYSGSNSGESTFNAYSSGPAAHKDTDFGQYASSSSSNSKRIPAFPGYPRPILENYPEGSDHSNVQGYHGSSGSSYPESDHAFSPYSPSGLEYSFGKQKDEPYKGGNKYSDVYSIPSETRYTRGNAGHASHNHDVPPYISSSGPSGHLLKMHGSGNVWYSSGKPGKYSYKYLSRYAPNTGVTYLSRDRDGYYTPFNKGGGKLIIIKDTRPSYAGGHVYSDEPSYAGGYRSKSAGYATSPNFSGYSGNSSYDDGPAMLRRYRNAGGLLLQKAVYP
ncbi:probable ATP-dependent RNA helicase ddx17 [Linepithema humile]|uniref:probable ATP-dependent RNA helicase ddx17 n=1 Tax=Linepithema humile TaxID=83485 RepID=UPI0006238351|nr:PREDICTED: prisilkin-39-like [Linepithema humile]